MPTEDRRVIFSSDEVYKALYALSVKKEMEPPPPGFVKTVSEKKGDPSQIVIELENPGQQKFSRAKYSRDFLAAALMMFCRGAGIPLPKTAKKSVMIKDGQVILRVEIG